MCGNEANWQQMMSQGQQVSREEFLSSCDLSELLDEGESPEEYLDNAVAGDPDGSGFYKSVWGDTPCYFFQTHGFEFIFVP